MTTPHPAAIRWRRYSVLVLLFSVQAAPVTAQVPDAVRQRIVDLNVQMNEARFQRNSHEIDADAWNARRKAIDDELNPMMRNLREQLSRDEFRSFNSELQGQISARMAILRPQWESRAEKFKEQQEAHEAAVLASVDKDAATALVIQKRRMALQQGRDKGELTEGDFAAQDKEALDQIMALRTKYAAEGRSYAERFDRQLARLTEAAAKPAAPQAAPPPKQAERPVTRPATPPGNDAGFLRAPPSEPERLPQSYYDKIVLRVVFGIFVVGGGGVLYVLYRLFLLGRAAQQPVQQVSSVHGTAHYAPPQLTLRDKDCLAKGLFFGKSSAPEQRWAPIGAPGVPVCSTPEHHTLIVARTRTGKGTRVIVPTLLRYGGSALVIDPKGENAAITAAARRDQLHQDIHILNPWNELASTYQRRSFAQATFNPLDILDRLDPNVVAIAQTLASAICPAPANAKDKFWQGSAANILTAVFLWLADQPTEQKTLGRAREIVSLTRRDFRDRFLIPMAASEAFSGAIREFAAPFIDLADETYSGVMSNLSESTKFLSDPQVKAATAKSSFSMRDLATRKTTVYVVIPTERMDTQKTWLRLVVAAAMHVFKHPQEKLAYGHRCLFLIDEFAALGRLDDLPRDIATMSGFGVDFALIVQGLDQLKDHYAEARGTILSNCAYKWFCNVNDLDSAKYLSDTLGKATVATISRSESQSHNPGGSGSGQTTSYGETGRNLLNPDEVLNLGRDVAIAIQPNGYPQYLRPVDYWTLPEAFGSLRESHPQLYWQPALSFDENPYFTPKG